MGGGDERREFGKLLGVGEVAMVSLSGQEMEEKGGRSELTRSSTRWYFLQSFNGLVTMLKSLIDDRTRLEILSKQMLAPRTAVEDQSRLFGSSSCFFDDDTSFLSSSR